MDYHCLHIGTDFLSSHHYVLFPKGIPQLFDQERLQVEEDGTDRIQTEGKSAMWD